MVNKRGSEAIVWPQIIWMVIFMMIFVVSIIFINKAVSGAFIYEEVYAKKIALIIDGSRSESKFYIDVSDALESVKKNKYNCTSTNSERNNDCFFIEGNMVRVKLFGEDEGYEYAFFSDYEIELVLVESQNKLIIGVRDE